MARHSRLPLFVSLALLAACGASTSAEGPDQPGATDGPVNEQRDAATGPSAAAAAPPPADAGAILPCPDVAAYCKTYNVRSSCTPAPGAPLWTDETCAGGCARGECSSTECVDECALGQVQDGRTCKLWSLATQSFGEVDTQRLHDRARDYDQHLRSTHLPVGSVLNAMYTDAARTTIAQYTGTNDAAIWTGSALAAAAWRYEATGAPDAHQQLDAMVRTLHFYFTVRGEPGGLARLALRSDSPLPIEPRSGFATPCENPEWHCNHDVGGISYNWLGRTSRDAYTGVMLGYAIAYQATRDEALRALIREDVVTMVRELITPHELTVRFEINGIPFHKTITLENVILEPSEMKDGKAVISGDVSDAAKGDGNMLGFREFMPDLKALIKPLTGVSVPVRRASSAIMLGSFVRMALTMTEGVAGHEADHQEIDAYYQAHVDQWLDIAESWDFETNCGKKYYANHIAYIMAYVYAHLETDAAIAVRIRDHVLGDAMWGALSGHKNVYFAYLWAGTRTGAPDAAVVTAANAQLAQFPAGPRVDMPRDNLASPAYLPHDATCTDPQLSDIGSRPLDVQDRVVEDFLWQRQPWQLVSSGDPRRVMPGVDYLAAYWAGRAHGLLPDDSAGTCARYAE